jgi:drug/metabolite transporter (DMT)-like permease
LIKAEESSRPEAAFVLLLMQALFWLIAGISAVPFALAGEVYMAALGLATMLLALATLLLGIGVLWRRPRARGWAIALQVVCLAGTAILLLVPIGFNRGVVSMLVNVVLPIAVIVLLGKERSGGLAR